MSAPSRLQSKILRVDTLRLRSLDISWSLMMGLMGFLGQGGSHRLAVLDTAEAVVWFARWQNSSENRRHPYTRESSSPATTETANMAHAIR